MASKKIRPEIVARTECQLFRDFCASSVLLLDQFERFKRARTLSYPTLRDLLGESTNRGSLWRLKDAAHILFSNKNNLPGQLLDCIFGSIFHETIKLMEAAYQSQYYASGCKMFASEMEKLQSEKFLSEDAVLEDSKKLLTGATQNLLVVLEDSIRDVKQGIKRLQTLLDASRPLLCLCFAGKNRNHMLLKFLEGRSELVSKVMGNSLDAFITAVYSAADNKSI